MSSASNKLQYGSGDEASDGSHHCLANGRYCAYSSGADIWSLFGPPYSSPSYLSLKVIPRARILSSKREPGAAIWHHALGTSGANTDEIIDFIDAELPVLVRHVQVQKTLRMELNVHDYPQIACIPNSASYPGAREAMLVKTLPGLTIMQSYTFPSEQYHQLVLMGQCRVGETKGRDFFYIDFEPGESMLYMIGGPSYEECVLNTEAVLKSDCNALYQRTRQYWKAFTARRVDFAAMVPEGNPHKPGFLEVADDISILLKTQQSKEGGEAAGGGYRIGGYIRDQYGVSRGYLALGYYSEAKELLKFYWNVWQRSGVLHNAQAMGLDGVFHIHENDEVEQTGYLILQAFDYFDRTKDDAFMAEIFPMLEWAWAAQKRHLHNGMLPFNGDETYVAGGILPRSVLNEGSAEATLLFFESGQKLLAYARGHGLVSGEAFARDTELLVATGKNFRKNFVHNGQLMANNPARKEGLAWPRFRRGCCDNRKVQHASLMVTQCTENKHYLCPECFVTDYAMPADPPQKMYFLPSISLTALYVRSTLLSRAEIQCNLEVIFAAYKETGKITSLPGSSRTIGYEFGLLLYALVELDDSRAAGIYQEMLEARDVTGAWVEYYDDELPAGCRYRPWESGINIDAAIQYILMERKQK